MDCSPCPQKSPVLNILILFASRKLPMQIQFILPHPYPDSNLAVACKKHPQTFGWAEKREEKAGPMGAFPPTSSSCWPMGTCPPAQKLDKLARGHKGEKDSKQVSKRGEEDGREPRTDPGVHVKIMFSLLCSCKGKISCDLKDLRDQSNAAP